MRFFAGVFLLMAAGFFVWGCLLAWESRGASLVLTWPVAAAILGGAWVLWDDQKR